MSDVLSTSLIDVARYKAFTGVPADETADENGPIEAHIDAASALISRYCGRTFITPTAATVELLDGNGRCELYVRNKPIVATTAPVLEWYDGSAWQTVTNWTYIAETGLLYFTNSAYFYDGKRNYRLTYLYGYSRANLPGDLAYACAQLVFRTMKKLIDKQEGVSSESFDTHNISYDLNKIPPDLKAILDGYKVVAIG